MQELKARFSLLDDMSAQIERIAEAGMQMVEQFEDAGSAAGDAFDGIESGVATAAGSVDGVATSIGNVQEATDSAAAAMDDYGNAATGAAGQADALANSAESAAEAAESFTDAADGYGNAAEQAASQTDYWTEAVGNYDKSALEAVYSTEELVEMGFKSADALEEQERMFELCEQSASNLSKSIEATSDIQSDLNAAMEQAAEVMTSVSLQEMGLSLDNAISLLASLELYGMNSTTVITAMRTAVKNFSADGLDAQTALQSTITEIANMENAADATALAIDTFGSRAGVDMANAIRSGAISIETLTGNLDVAQGTLSSTAETAQTLDQKWEQASKNINSAFTTTVQPTVDKLSSGFADLANSVGDFLNDHPTVTKAITAIGVGAGTVAVAIAGVAFATSSAIPAIVSFGVSLNAALGPIGWVALGITAVTAAVAAFVAMSDDEQAATERLTYSTREHEATLEQLNAEYDEAVSKYGASSEQAGELAVQISRLEAAYGDAGKTIGQFVEEIEQTGEAIADIQTKYDDAVTSASDLEKGSMNLASQLMVLSSQSDITSADLDLMSGIVDKLNDNYGELSLAVDKTTGKLNMSVPELYSFIQEKADEQKKTAATDALTEAISKYGEARKQMQDASTEVGAAWDNYQEMTEKWRTEHPIKAYLGEGAEMNWDKDLGQAFDDWEALKDASAEASENYNQLEEQIRHQNPHKAGIERGDDHCREEEQLPRKQDRRIPEHRPAGRKPHKGADK